MELAHELNDSQKSTKSQSHQTPEKELTKEQKAIQLAKKRRTAVKKDVKKTAKMAAKEMMEEAAAKMIEAQMLEKQRKKNPVHNKKLTPYEAYKLERIE